MRSSCTWRIVPALTNWLSEAFTCRVLLFNWFASATQVYRTPGVMMASRFDALSLLRFAASLFFSASLSEATTVHAAGSLLAVA
jgi:hypothetical protein